MIQLELERIRLSNGGILNPHDVVETAADENNVLHDSFCWDNEQAAGQYRLVQARQLIRVCVTKVDSLPDPVRVYVSLESDRIDGGYRARSEVLAEAALRVALLQQAKRELRRLAAMYGQLEELAGIFSAIKAVA
jgi:hypothetical protein